MRFSANLENLKEVYRQYRKEKEKGENVEFTFYGKACNVTLGKPPEIKKRSSRLVEEDLIALEEVLMGKDLELFYEGCRHLTHVKVINDVTWPVVPEADGVKEVDGWVGKARKYEENKEKANESLYFLFKALDKLDSIDVESEGLYIPSKYFLIPRGYEVKQEGDMILVKKNEKEVFMISKFPSINEMVDKIAVYNVPRDSEEDGIFSLEVFDGRNFKNFLESMSRKGKKNLPKLEGGREIIEEKLASLECARELLNPTLRLMIDHNFYSFGDIPLPIHRTTSFFHNMSASSRVAKILIGLGVLSTLFAGIYFLQNIHQKQGKDQEKSPTNPSIDEKVYSILSPLKKDKTLFSHLLTLSDVRVPKLSNATIKNLNTIIQGYFGNDSDFIDLGLNSSYIQRIYRIESIACGAINRIFKEDLNTTHILLAIEMDKYNLKNYGDILPSKDFTFPDAVAKNLLANALNWKGDKRIIHIIGDANAVFFIPTMKNPPIIWHDAKNYAFRGGNPYEDKVPIEYNFTALKDYYAYLDAYLNETSLHYDQLSDWRRENSLQTLLFWYDVFPRELVNDTLATFAVQPTSFGWFGWHYSAWPPEDMNLFSVDNSTLQHFILNKVGLNFTRRMMEKLEKNRPELVYPVSFRKGENVETYAEKILKISYPFVVGCQDGSTFAAKCYRSVGMIAIPHYFFLERENGHVDGHYSLTVVLPKSVQEKLGRKLIWSFPIVGNSSELYYLDPQAFINYFSSLKIKPLGLYIMNVAKERNPFIVIYDYRLSEK